MRPRIHVSGLLKPLPRLRCKPLVGPQPEHAVLILSEFKNPVPRQPILGRERSSAAILPPRQPLAGSNPQRPVLALQQAAHIVARQRGRRVPVEDLEPVAVEAHQPHLGAQPDKSISCLHQGLHRILRQPVLHYPGLPSIAGERRRGLQSQASRRASQRSGHQQRSPSQPAGSARTTPPSPAGQVADRLLPTVFRVVVDSEHRSRGTFTVRSSAVRKSLASPH